MSHRKSDLGIPRPRKSAKVVLVLSRRREPVRLQCCRAVIGRVSKILLGHRRTPRAMIFRWCSYLKLFRVTLLGRRSFGKLRKRVRSSFRFEKSRKARDIDAETPRIGELRY
jgi:hypothetical protein